jgi:hypothetical protein
MNQGPVKDWTPEEQDSHLADVRAILRHCEPPTLNRVKQDDAARMQDHRAKQKATKPKAKEGHKICNHCGKEKPLDDFGIAKGRPGEKNFRRSRCKPCLLEYWRERHKRERAAKSA